jgi:hypothetical protein
MRRDHVQGEVIFMVKKVHGCTIECPECAKIIDVFKEVEVIVPAQKAEKKERYFAEKSIQMTLDVNQT